MYLKRLNLNGFKSFASATTLEFGPGVTCIAGPNGSGKTNIAEAIRWVLGEQANRSLRARKTEDVIFSGSDRRPAQGMAEVKLTLDNGDGWLPVDFEEVVVGRRAYRNGDNEYYLNQSRVRLKDLNELFMKAQVGQNSYAFMGQGLVEHVLTLRPEERRGLIEEAADVRLHREKLNESQRRLAATRDNLDRIELLAREIAPRLRQLERQAERATEHARLSAELADALKTLYGQQWQDAQEALTAARAACDQRQEAFEQAHNEATAFEEGRVSLASAIDERRRDIAEREERYRTLDQYRRDLEQRINVDGERQAMLESRGDELSSESEVLREERQRVAALAEQQRERAAELTLALERAHEPDAGAQELARIDARLQELQKQITGADELATRAGAQAAGAQARLSALQEQQERVQAETAMLTERRREQIASLKAWAKEFASLRARSVELTPVEYRTAGSLKAARERLERASLAVVRREEELRTLAAAIQAAETRLEAAQAAGIDLPPADAGVKALLQAGGKDPEHEPAADSHIHGLIGMVGQLLRVPAGLERAIEAALADSLHAVVVETQEDAMAAIELLVSEDLGRATLYPISDLRPIHPINLLDEKGVLGVASELVRCDARYRPLVDTLLGRTIVAENVGLAKQLLRRGLGNVVTLDGTLLHPVGSMTGGSAKAVRRAFTHKRDVGELPNELEHMRASHKEATDALEGEHREQAEAREERDRLAPMAERTSGELAAANEALRQQQARLPAIAARLATLHARLLDTRTTSDRSSGELTKAQASLDEARTQAEEQRALSEQLAPQNKELAASRQALAQSDAERTSRIRPLETEQRALQQQAEVQSASLQRIEAELHRRVGASDRIDGELNTVLARLESSKHELETKTQEAATAREELAPAHHALEQIESRQRTIDSDLADGRSKSLAAERVLLEAQSSVKLRTEELEALRERLAEDGFSPLDDGEIGPIEVATDEAPSPEEPETKPGGPPAWLKSEAAAADDRPPMRGGAPVDTVMLKDRISELRGSIRKLGPVNEQAEEDFSENRERHEYLTTQLSDLREAEEALQEAIRELESIIKERFSSTYRQVNASFQRYFQTFFGGGQAELLLTKTDEEDALAGVDIVAQPPRKKVRSLDMLSGGERSLTAMALLFALLDTNPSPICVLDEVDAALDESNVGRFNEALKALSERTQFIIITHNRRTLEMADTIYGVSMGEDSTSTLLSLRLSDVPEKA
ncbi:MAG: chromosome segregation protein SMC [Chloroflexi bacterium]|nr:chromosome segregation protein SMC [Chloroflexota bacterium]